MRLLKLLELMRRHLKPLVRVCCAVLILLVVLDAIPAVVDKHHAHTSAERIPGFWTGFGFAGCLLIIFLSKWYGKGGIVVREDYYDE